MLQHSPYHYAEIQIRFDTESFNFIGSVLVDKVSEAKTLGYFF